MMASSNFKDILSNSLLVGSGPPAVHRLRTRTNKSGTLTRVTFGEKNLNRPNRSILLVGETGKGKPALINALLNYSTGVMFEDGVWFQIVDEEEESSQSDVVIYQIFGFEGGTLPFSLTIIDTPGYGDTRGTQHDDKVSQMLFELLKRYYEAPELHAVGLVMKATDDLVSDGLRYIFNSVVSLFGTENTVALITHSDGMPPHDVLKALKYVIRTRKVQITEGAAAQKYEQNPAAGENRSSLMGNVLLDFLIQKMKEGGDEAKVKKLEEMDNKLEDRTRSAMVLLGEFSTAAPFVMFR